MREQDNDRPCGRGSGLFWAFVTGAGAATAAIYLAQRLRQPLESMSVERVLQLCDSAAAKLDDRLSAHTSAA